MTSPGVPGQLSDNIVYFARVLRRAGLPVGSGLAADAVAAIEATGFSNRDDLHTVLHAVFVKSRSQTPVFDAAFDAVWRRRGVARHAETAAADGEDRQRQKPGAARVADALQPPRPPAPASHRDVQQVAVSEAERLRDRDFAQMSAAEIAEARAAIDRLHLRDDRRPTRRWRLRRDGSEIDRRASLRQTLRRGGDMIALQRRARREKPAPVVAICDISGSMSEYTRLFLHFLHRLALHRPVQTFLFGTRLSNVTRALRLKDVDAALAQCAAVVPDWSGGTRISASLARFNRLWSRRVLGQGAVVLLFTDGLERDGIDDLEREADRLQRSCRRLVWLNPLLRFAAFEPRAAGVRALLPKVDSFRPIHNLRSMEDLVTALGEGATARDPTFTATRPMRRP